MLENVELCWLFRRSRRWRGFPAINVAPAELDVTSPLVHLHVSQAPDRVTLASCAPGHRLCRPQACETGWVGSRGDLFLIRLWYYEAGGELLLKKQSINYLIKRFSRCGWRIRMQILPFQWHDLTSEEAGSWRIYWHVHFAGFFFYERKSIINLYVHVYEAKQKIHVETLNLKHIVMFYHHHGQSFIVPKES